MWLSLAFLSAALLGLYDVAKKYYLRENAVIPVLFCNTLFCALIFLPFIVASHTGILGSESLLCVDNWQWHEQRFIVLKSFIVLSSWILGYYAIKHLPITIVGPVNATRPVLTLLGALIIFGERLNGWQWAGVLLAVTSFYMLSRSGKKEGIRFSHNRWIYYLVAAALLGAVSGLYDKFLMSPTGAGIRAITVQCWYNFYQCVIMGIVLLVVWLPQRKASPFRWRWSIMLISVFITLADAAYFYALTYPDAMISVTSMVRRGSVIVSFCFGAMIFREKNLRSKAVDLCLVLLSMACLWIGGH